MSISRREFLHCAAATGLLTVPLSRALALGSGAAPLRILILGGTGFLGPACTESAIAKGHHVTHFNRGRIETRRKEAGRPSAVPDGVETLYGNRDPEKTADEWKGPQDGEKDAESPKGLSQLVGKKWDAVIDTSGYVPRIVKASAELLAPNVGFYVFISSISVYSRNDEPNADETAEIAAIADPTTEEMGADFSNYGPLKALSEQAAEAAMPGRVANVRPGFIVGPRDTSNRFMYWPRRASEGGEMIVPGGPTDPFQMIDVRDLADFILNLIETRSKGTFNVTSPTTTMQEMVNGCVAAAAAVTQTPQTKPTWIDPSFLEENQVQAMGTFPLWLPPEGATAGFHRRNVSRAIEAGLKIRSIEETAKGSLEWYRSLPEETKSKVGAITLPADREAAVLAAWASKNAEKPK